MKKLLYISILLLSCNKEKFDGAYWNTDRRPQVILVSERFTNPPKWNKNEWKADTTIYHFLDRDVDYRSYQNLKPDTTKSTCAIQGTADSLFIEIRKYKIKFY